MSMANNDTTYNDKWDTMENNAALKKLDEKFFNKSVCRPSCPVGWAPEVLDLLEYVEKSYGIARNTSTIRSYYVSKNIALDFFKSIKGNVWYALKTKDGRKGKKYSRTERLTNAKDALVSAIARSALEFQVKYVNEYLNKVFKPKVTLSQIKEKFGYLTLYFHCDNEEYKRDIDEKVSETIIKLTLKGCYYPMSELLKNNEEHYVKTMTRMGLDIEKIKRDSIFEEMKKADPV